MEANEKLENKLTPAALQYINEVCLDYRKDLLQRASESARDNEGEIKEITVNDLIGSQKQGQEKISNIKRKKKLSSMIIFMGMSYLLIGITIYLYQNFKFDLKTGIGVVIGLMGLFVSMFGFFSFQLIDFLPKKTRTVKKENNTMSKFDIVKKWNEIEVLIRDEIVENKKIDSSAIPIRIIVDTIKSNYLNKENDLKYLNEIINTRNQILHGNIGIDDWKLSKDLEFLDFIKYQIVNKKNSSV